MTIKLKETLVLFFIQVALYGLLCINYRAVALAHYHESAITNFIIASMNFFIIQKIAQSSEVYHQWIGYVLGSVAGSYLGIYLSVLINS